MVSVSLTLGKGDYSNFEFFILPTYSYFGDYQILYNLKSQLTYQAGDGKLLVTLCLKKQKLLQMMEDYPEARKFYMDRAWARRSEFRRRQKKFIQKLVQENIIFNNDLSLNSIQNNDEKESGEPLQDSFNSSSDEDVKIDISDPARQFKIKDKHIRELIDKKISKFYHNIDVEVELGDDIPTDELEGLSEDEILED